MTTGQHRPGRRVGYVTITFTFDSDKIVIFLKSKVNSCECYWFIGMVCALNVFRQLVTQTQLVAKM